MFCAHVDGSVVYTWKPGSISHELWECTYEHHGEYPPMNAITDIEGRLLVSPVGTSCSYFMSRAW